MSMQHSEIIAEGNRLTGLIRKAEARGDSQLVDQLLQDKQKLIHVQAGMTKWLKPHAIKKPSR
jgi:hypothetical protein